MFISASLGEVLKTDQRKPSSAKTYVSHCNIFFSHYVDNQRSGQNKFGEVSLTFLIRVRGLTGLKDRNRLVSP